MPLIKEIKAKGTPPDSSLLQGTFDTKAQAALCNAIAVDLGFSLEQGRLDVSVHPFTGGLCPHFCPPIHWRFLPSPRIQCKPVVHTVV